MNEFPKLEEKYEKAILGIINAKNLNIKEQKDLNLLFEEFYKKFGTFTIFEEAKNPKFLIAMSKVKKNEIEKQKKSQHLVLGSKPTGFKPEEGTKLLSTSNLPEQNDDSNHKISFENGNISDTELRSLAKNLEKCRRNEMDFIRNQNKKWETKKEIDNIKFINNDEEDKKKEMNMKKFFINCTIQENAFSNEQFLKLLSILKNKKQKEYEKDPYVTDYKVTLDTINNSPYSWEQQVEAEKEETNDLTQFNILMNKNMLNNIIKLNNSVVPKIEKKSSPMKKKIYKDKSVDKHNYKYSYEGSKAWKNFENDLNRFIKDQEV